MYMDERQDPEKSTRAAAHHLKDLYNQFGDWYLAMAAYNSGPGTVQSAVKRTGYADFWELYRRNVLPRETRNYVPIIVATTIMAKNPTLRRAMVLSRSRTSFNRWRKRSRISGFRIQHSIASWRLLQPSLR